MTGVWPFATVAGVASTVMKLPMSFSSLKKSMPGWMSSREPPLATEAAKTPANAEPDNREHDSSSATGVSDSAFYVLGGRVVAVRRDPVPRGAYGGQGVDYSPDMTTWVIGSRCAQ